MQSDRVSPCLPISLSPCLVTPALFLEWTIKSHQPWNSIKCRSQKGTNALGVFVPFTCFRRQSLATRLGQFVPLATTAGGLVPFAANQLVRFQAMQQRVQSSRLNVDQSTAGRTQLLLQQVAVFPTPCQ